MRWPFAPRWAPTNLGSFGTPPANLSSSPDGATAVGLVLATVGLRVVAALEFESLTRAIPPWVSPRAALLIGILSCGIAAVVSLLMRMLPTTSTVALRGGGATGTPRPRRLLREAMMVTQVAAALVIASGAGLLFRSAMNLGTVDPGIETRDVWFADVALPALRYRSFADVSQFFEELARRLEADPTIRRVGFTNEPPLSGLDGCSLVFVENRPLAPDERPVCVATPQLSPGALEALGVAVEGRNPGWTSEAEGEVVVSRAFAERFWPDESPFGKGVRGNGDEPPFYRVVGVADDIRADGLDRPVEEAVYFPLLPIDGAPLWSPPRAAR